MGETIESREIKFLKNLNLTLDRVDTKRQCIVRRSGEQSGAAFPSRAAAVRHWERALFRLAMSAHFFDTLAMKAENLSKKEIEPLIAWLESPGSPYPPALSMMQGVVFEPTTQWRRRALKIFRNLNSMGTDAEEMLRKKTASILRNTQQSKPKTHLPRPRLIQERTQ